MNKIIPRREQNSSASFLSRVFWNFLEFILPPFGVLTFVEAV